MATAVGADEFAVDAEAATTARSATRRTSAPASKPDSRTEVRDIGEAIVHRLRRYGPDHLRVGEAIAVLGEAASPDTVATILGAEPAAVRRICGQLSAAKLLDHTAFPHRDVVPCLLRGMRVDVRRQLHNRAAEILYAEGAGATAVADHLIRSGDSRYEWAPRVLRAAAEQALALDRIDRAGDCLELAYRTSADANDRAEIAAALASLEWRVNPSAATRNFARLHAAVRAGTLSVPALRGAVRYLLWHGRFDDARSAWTLLKRDAGTGPESAFLRSWIAYTYPELTPRHRGDGPSPADRETPPAFAGMTETTTAPEPAESSALAGALSSADTAPSAHHLGTTLLSRITAQTDPDATVAMAHGLLSRHRLDSGTVEALTTALEALIYTGRLDVAAAWCDTLLAEAVARSSPTWRAVFAGLRAEIALRQGRVDVAADHAVQALNQIPAGNQGTVVARPLSYHVRALTVAGRYDEAGAQLEREVPLSLFDSRLALPYLHARGHLALATARVEEALVDFELCGALMRRWDMDVPGLVAWRNDLALGYLLSGDHRRARIWAERHLEQLGDPRRHGTGGVSLRLIAATTAPPDRVALLRQAEAISRRGDDRFELAVVLADLGGAWELIGESERARSLRRAALRLAGHCGAEPLARRLSGETTVPDPAGGGGGDIGSLSVAEHRVADLAAKGMRNRDIAAELGITTSTVEQHLTRVYRKLKVRRRTELRFMLSTRC
ncbi:helix-turn-helix transcriptional regulator [Nocardia amamiensis]|uniref:helix-turn-helix transcriptional regulator n=1 Tax=Nocardia amamiensis TaxID=404578 RepID=UPI000834C9C4|nr:LuxR family transcriptional regulator [Nocardia amamiensis]